MPVHSTAYRIHTVTSPTMRSTSAAILLYLMLPTSSGFVVSRKYLRTTCGATTDDDGLFDYFDPLLSPHAYPKGIGAPIEEQPLDDSSKWNRDKKSSKFGIELPEDNGKANGSSIKSTVSPQTLPTVFDPTLSPHEYAHGTPEAVVGDTILPQQQQQSTLSNPVVGILLIDHGSRNQASNDRLHELARLYCEYLPRPAQETIVVQAAHMELAKPSIEEGMALLLEQSVDEIVCHPFFLSPQGRHTTEDIPALVESAMERLSVTVPVMTTQPVGSRTDVMIKAIDSLVKQSSESYRRVVES